MNFATDVVEAARSGRRALVAIARDGTRREWTFGVLAAAARELAGARRRSCTTRASTRTSGSS